MTTWATSTPIRHPWFSQSTTKRKHSTSSGPPGYTLARSSSPSSSPPPTKRQKLSALESGFAHLTLNGPRSSPTFSPPSSHVSDFLGNSHELPSLMNTDSGLPCTVDLPASIEEPPAPEVKMKTASWYEPEPNRIIITNLDSSSDEEDEVDPNTATITIPRALLKQLSTHSRKINEPLLPNKPSQALVLFQPLPIKQIDSHIPRDGWEAGGVNSDVMGDIQSDDAMEVEPW